MRLAVLVVLHAAFAVGAQIEPSGSTLVVVTWSGQATDADFESFFADQRALLARRMPYVQIADASRAQVMSSTQRRLMAQFSTETSDAAARLCKGTAVVISSTLVRGAMTAVSWLVKFPYPIAIVGTFDEAMRQTERWAADAGLAIPRTQGRVGARP